MNIIKYILKNFFTKQKTLQLGRWNLDYCNKKINRKIDLSNEDHCGPCGYNNIKIIKYDKNKNK
jgi:hypothetical protein